MKQLAFLPRFRVPILNGIKTQTARISRHGIEQGDEILAISNKKPFARLSIKNIERRTLGSFDEDDAYREGLPSLAEFITVWKQIHPRKGFDPNQKVDVLHFFVSLFPLNSNDLGE
jgi:hypothetical protein